MVFKLSLYGASQLPLHDLLAVHQNNLHFLHVVKMAHVCWEFMSISDGEAAKCLKSNQGCYWKNSIRLAAVNQIGLIFKTSEL